ncbi:MAG: GGDEF domain-containing protein [Rhodospirillales bacterium]|nr:GGDEF domain-containing protein [Rhodospirillales bacterium]
MVSGPLPIRTPSWRRGTLEALLLAGLVLSAGAVSYIFDLDGSSLPGNQIDFDELLGLATIFLASFSLFAWRRIAELEAEVSLRRRAEERARFLSEHDALTGLANRRQFEQVLHRVVRRAPAPGRAHALFMLDLNGFKKVNDRWGHAEGDAVLQAAAERLKQVMRSGDLLVRVGGDEFAIVAADIDGMQGASALARRIAESLADPIAVNGREHQIGTGVGIALVPQDGHDVEALLRRADLALYAAKARGISEPVFFEPRLEAAAAPAA